MRIFIINDVNDILKKRITHFSLDKGLYLGHGLAENNCTVYFLTTGVSCEENNILFKNIDEADEKFLLDMDLIIIIREAVIPNLLETYLPIKNIILNKNKKTKIMIKSDSTQWIVDKKFRNYISKNFKISSHLKFIVKWVNEHFDYICVQTKEFRKDAKKLDIPKNKIIVLNMAIPNINININEIENPYDVNHSYCVANGGQLNNSGALLPLYYVKNPHLLNEFNKKRNIIVYTGRVKTDGGKIFYFMREIMDKIGNEYELHIFPGSFIIPNINTDGSNMLCSANNVNHLVKLRESIFLDSKNIIIHYPFEHKDMYKYVCSAYCGIDFSDMRPKDDKCKAGHAKILEYCSVGLPIVCEENINNLFLINNGKNGIVLPYLSNVEDYIRAIKKIGTMKINREFCRKITLENENCVKRSSELLNLIKLKNK